MSRIKLERPILIGFTLALFILWCAMSWYWYVCGIRDFCSESPNVFLEAQYVPNLPLPTPITSLDNDECPPYLLAPVGIGMRNNHDDVRRVERFLNVFERADLAEDGLYGFSDIQAVKRFEYKYAELVLIPRGIEGPTGRVHDKTKDLMDALACKYYQQYYEIKE